MNPLEVPSKEHMTQKNELVSNDWSSFLTQIIYQKKN